MKSLASAGVLFLWVAAAGAQPLALSDDFQVNTLILGYQDGVDVGVAGSDDFVVVWHSPVSGGSDTSSNSIQVRRWAGDGSPRGVEFQANTYTSDFQGWPALAVTPAGDFVVVWTSYQADADSDGGSIQGRLFDANGNPVGDQFQVNSYTTNSQQWPDVAMDADGDFVVVWQSFFDATGGDADGWSIQGQRFATGGQPQGGQFQVNSFTTYAQVYPRVATNDGGDFVVVWQSYRSSGTDSAGFSALGQRFASNGSLQGSEFQVNTYTTGDQYFPDVSLSSDGDFVVVWQDNDFYGSGYGVDGDASGIVARRYSAAGAPQGSQFVVNTFTQSSQSYPSVGFDSTDRFVVSWTSDGSPGSDDWGESIQARRYEPDGMPIGPEFQVNTHTDLKQYNSKLDFGSEGRFVVAWASYSSAGSDDNATSPQARRFFEDGALFRGAFESGGFSEWSGDLGACPIQLDVSFGGAVINGCDVEINGIVMPAAGCPHIDRLNWDWDDGTDNDSWFPAVHTYSADGDYSVVVTAFDASGRTATDTGVLQVNACSSP